MYDREHRFFASALVVSLVACVAFAAALGLAPSQKAYASDIDTQASGYTEVQLLEYINTNIETMLTGFGMLGENTSQSHPTFRWLYTAIQQINSWVFQIYADMDDINERVGYMFTRLGDIRDALVSDSIEINGQTLNTVRHYARLTSEYTDSMSDIVLAWNRDMGASQNGTGTDATWFSTVSSRLLATVNAINSANTNLISIDSKFWEYFLVPQRWQQQDGSYYYSPAYYFQYLKLQYDQMQSYFLTGNQISVDGNSYKTPHWYLNNLNDMIVNTNYYTALLQTDVRWLKQLFSQEQLTMNDNTVVTPYYYLKNLNENISSMKTDSDMLVKLLSQDNVTINGQSVSTPYYFLRQIYRSFVHSTVSQSVNSITESYRAMFYALIKSIGFESNKWVDANTGLQNLSGFYGSWNSFVKMVNDYLDSLIYLLETPDSNTSQQLIGDFDDDAYDQNMQQLRQQLGQVGVFSAVTSLGMIVYTISDADTLQTPSLDVPFEFAGSNDYLVIDLSWLDDFKPMINFACMALLFLQLAAWTIEAVKQT